jgi:hypothetical protein
MLTFLAILFPVLLLGGGIALERFERQLTKTAPPSAAPAQPEG